VTSRSRARTAVDQRPHLAEALVGARVEHVGIARIEHHLVDAGVVVHVQDAVPRLAAVGGLVEAAIAARAPQRALGSGVHHVAVARINCDLPDVLGVLEPDVRPRLAAVGGPAHAVVVGDAALAVVLAGARPHGERIVRVDRDAADRV
jgi:hypothetical protein